MSEPISPSIHAACACFLAYPLVCLDHGECRYPLPTQHTIAIVPLCSGSRALGSPRPVHRLRLSRCFAPARLPLMPCKSQALNDGLSLPACPSARASLACCTRRCCPHSAALAHSLVRRSCQGASLSPASRQLLLYYAPLIFPFPGVAELSTDAALASPLRSFLAPTPVPALATLTSRSSVQASPPRTDRPALQSPCAPLLPTPTGCFFCWSLLPSPFA